MHSVTLNVLVRNRFVVFGRDLFGASSDPVLDTTLFYFSLTLLLSLFSLTSRFSAACHPATSVTSWSWRASSPSRAWTKRTRPAHTRSWRRSAASSFSFLCSSWASRTCFLPSAPKRRWCPWRSGPETGRTHLCVHVLVHSFWKAGRSVTSTQAAILEAASVWKQLHVHFKCRTFKKLGYYLKLEVEVVESFVCCQEGKQQFLQSFNHGAEHLLPINDVIISKTWTELKCAVLEKLGFSWNLKSLPVKTTPRVSSFNILQKRIR